MARVARVVAVDYPHHITQRGNNHQIVFSDDSDYPKYLSFVKKYSQEYDLGICCYCLMPNHVHFIAIPHNEFSLAKTFNFAHMRYSQYFNKKQRQCGHLWQGRFYSCVLDEPHLVMAAQYIERNPVRAKIVKKAQDWKWSSANYNTGKQKNDLVINTPLFGYISETQSTWERRLEKQDEENDMEAIRRNTKTGLPLGKDKFILRLEEEMGRELQSKPRGRPWLKEKSILAAPIKTKEK